MTLPELWGWIELFLRNVGAWDYMTLAVNVIIVVTLSFWVLGRLSKA